MHELHLCCKSPCAVEISAVLYESPPQQPSFSLQLPAEEAGAVVNLHAAEINSGSTCRFHQNTCTVLLI